MDSQALAQELAESTLALCQIASVTGDEAAIADYVQGLCTEQIRSPFVRRIGNTVVARGTTRADRPTVALFGHLDTVRPATVQRLEIHPREGKVYGFQRASAAVSGEPELLSVDTKTGRGKTLPKSFSFTNGWSGACVSTKVSVTVAPPPEVPK